jgi:hypothetical protein
MFAPKPFDVAKEMVRVTKRGGRIVMGNWIPNDPTFVSQVLKISSAFTPPPPEGFVSPMTWGLETNIIERFGQAGAPKENISMVKDTYYFASPDKSPTQFIELFETFYGPTMNAVEAAQKTSGPFILRTFLITALFSESLYFLQKWSVKTADPTSRRGPLRHSRRHAQCGRHRTRRACGPSQGERGN